MILDHIDTAIGFITVMLLLSLVVTTIVQLLVWTVNLRGTNLEWGIEKLLDQIPGIVEADRQKVVTGVLKHPLLTTQVLWRRNLTAIRKDELKNLLPGVLADLAGRKEIVTATASKLASDTPKLIEDWFESVMDRSSEVFTLWTRAIATVVAMALAFAFGIDSLQLIHEISTNKELRTKLLAMADATLKTSSDLQAQAVADSTTIVQAIADAAKVYQAEKAQPALPPLAPPGNLQTPAHGEAWLRKELQGFANLERVVTIYQEQVALRARAIVERRHKELTALLTEAKKTGLVFGSRDTDVKDAKEKDPNAADRKTPQADPKDSKAPESKIPAGPRATVWGILMTGIFLSLGAPFWHTALRNVVALRPIVAAKVDKEQAAEKQPAAAPNSGR